MTNQNIEADTNLITESSCAKKDIVERDLVYMALTLASFSVALISINTALLG